MPGFVADNPATLVGVGPLDHRAVLTLVALASSSWLDASASNPLAYLASIFLVTAVGVDRRLGDAARRWFSCAGLLVRVFQARHPAARCSWRCVPAIVTVMMTDLFDSLSTFIGVAQASNLSTRTAGRATCAAGSIVDAIATLGAGLFGSSSGTAYVESIAGIRVGGRTGRTAVVTASASCPASSSRRWPPRCRPTPRRPC